MNNNKAQSHILNLVKTFQPLTMPQICQASKYTDYQTKVAIKLLERDLKIIYSQYENGYVLFTF
jgi:hypothetical protein